jgi:hypothetical protein
MRIFLVIVAAAAFALAGVIFSATHNAINEIEALIVVLVGAVCVTGAAIVQASVNSTNEVTAELGTIRAILKADRDDRRNVGKHEAVAMVRAEIAEREGK